MHGKPLDVQTAMWTRQAVLAYLDGEHNLSWIIGVISDSGDYEAALHFLRDLGNYGNAERREALRSRIASQAA